MLFRKELQRLIHFFIYHIYVKRKIVKTDTFLTDGFTIEVPPTVFHPQLYFSSKFLGSYIVKLDIRDKKVLDIGAGSGILSLYAARSGAQVVAVDINAKAVEATLKNAKMNGHEGNIVAIKSDLFKSLSPLDKKFDLIISNPPYYTGTPKDTSDAAWRGGDNYLFIRKLAEGISDFISATGKVLIVLSSDTDIKTISSIFEENHISLQTVSEKDFLFETLYILEGSLV
jgi:release factor glutamine methyltransferase